MMTTAVAGDPYVGLRSYDVDDRFRFFGRDRESYEVAALWLGNRLVTVHGAAGVGKTSLVAAGVVPIVSAHGHVLPVGRVSRSSPFPTAALRINNPYTFALLSTWSPGDPPTVLSRMSPVDFLRQQGVRSDRYGEELPLLAVIDRFEELFHDGPERRQYRDDFIAGLTAAVAALPHLRLLICVRDEALGALMPYETVISPRSRARFGVSAFTRSAAIDAVAGPIRETYRDYAPGAAETIVDQLRSVDLISPLGERTTVVTETVEPVHLQIVCTELWRSLPDDVTEITVEHARDYAGADRAMAGYCSGAIGRVAAAHGVPAAELGAWLLTTFVAESGARATVYAGVSVTGGMSNGVVRALEDEHVLRSEWLSGSRWYELAHDRLIRSIHDINHPDPGIVHEVSPADYLRAAETALADGELDLATTHAQDALRTSDGHDARTDAEAMSFLANVAVHRGHDAEAERWYRQAAQLFEVLQDAVAVGRLLAAIGGLLAARGAHADAAREWQAAQQRLPGNLTIQIDLARAFANSGQLLPAIGVYGSALTVDPAAAEGLSGRGQLLADMGDSAAALADLDRLGAVHPSHGNRPDVRSARALALAGLGRIAEAASEIAVAVQDAAEDAQVLMRAAMIARLSGASSRARELVERALNQQARLLPHQVNEARRLLRSLPADGGE